MIYIVYSSVKFALFVNFKQPNHSFLKKLESIKKFVLFYLVNKNNLTNLLNVIYTPNTIILKVLLAVQNKKNFCIKKI